MSISRRTALLATGAAAITTGVVTAPLASNAAGAKAALAGDTVLLARIEQFHDVYGELQDAWGKDRAHRAAVLAMPDCPKPPGFPTGGDYSARETFMEAHDAYRGWDQCNRLNEQTGALAKTIFGTPARTAKGALEKLKIAYIAVGNGAGRGGGDSDLETFQDLKAPWMETVIADFERLAGEARP